jgi:hypothetical protein
MSNSNQEIFELLGEAKKLAQRYRILTGKPLGITGEVAEFEAARLLGIKLVEARQAGYDATRVENGVTHRLQVKGRCVLPGQSNSQRMGSIDITKEFDGVLLVLMDEHMNATAIYEADRAPVIAAITKPGSKARNERGALAVSNFISIGRKIWSRDQATKPCRSLVSVGAP